MGAVLSAVARRRAAVGLLVAFVAGSASAWLAAYMYRHQQQQRLLAPAAVAGGGELLITTGDQLREAAERSGGDDLALDLRRGGERSAVRLSRVLEHGLDALEGALSVSTPQRRRRQRRAAKEMCERLETLLEGVAATDADDDEGALVDQLSSCEDEDSLTSLCNCLRAVQCLRVAPSAGGGRVGGGADDGSVEGVLAVVDTLLSAMERCRQPAVTRACRLLLNPPLDQSSSSLSAAGGAAARERALAVLSGLPRAMQLDPTGTGAQVVNAAEISAAALVLQLLVAAADGGRPGAGATARERVLLGKGMFALCLRNSTAIMDTFASQEMEDVVLTGLQDVVDGRLRGVEGVTIMATLSPLLFLCVDSASKIRPGPERRALEQAASTRLRRAVQKGGRFSRERVELLAPWVAEVIVAATADTGGDLLVAAGAAWLLPVVLAASTASVAAAFASPRMCEVVLALQWRITPPRQPPSWFVQRSEVWDYETALLVPVRRPLRPFWRPF
jgi:hypothetical protein